MIYSLPTGDAAIHAALVALGVPAFAVAIVGALLTAHAA